MGTSFDESKWMERAARRLRASGRPESQEQAALTKYLEDVRHIRSLSILVDWCTSQQLVVVFVSKDGGEYDSENKLITVGKTTSPQHQLHVLLHECGHHLVGKPKRHERFGMGFDNEEAAEKNTIHHRLDILEEEFEAWHRGWELAKSLKILRNSDKPAFDKNRTRSLKLYVDWASKSWRHGRKRKSQ